MKKTVALISSLFFSFILASQAVNLVEVQKKEIERRKKTTKSKYILTNDKIVEFSLKKGKSFVEADVSETEPATTAPDKGKKKINEQETEEYWRNRLHILNKNIEELTKRIEESQSALNRESSNFLIASTPSLQQQIKMNIDQLTSQLADLRENLKKMEADKEAFFIEARKAGVLPGWLR